MPVTSSKFDGLKKPLAILSAVFLLAQSVAWGEGGKSRFWDGEWTDAQSGYNLEIQDPDNSEYHSGEKKGPQKYFIPSPRQYEDVDPRELADYRKGDYSPYALVLFPQDMSYKGKPISKGYYQVKLAGSVAGSPATHLNTNPQESSQEGDDNGNSATQPISQNSWHVKAHHLLQHTKLQPAYDTIVLKKLGKVIAVLPIDRTERLSRQKKKKLPRRAIAQLVVEDYQPLLKVYLKQWVYIAAITPP